MQKRCFAFFLLASAVFSGCDEKRARRKPDPETSRQGQMLMTAAAQYYDGKASLSADGRVVAMISGRNFGHETSGEPLFRAYFQEIEPGGAVGEYTRLTPDGSEGSEIMVILAPDGKSAAVVVELDGSSDIFIYDLMGTGKRVTETPESEINIQFSPDSKLLAWSSKKFATEDESQSSRVSLIDLAKPDEIHVLDRESTENLFFLPGSGNYEMVVTAPGSSGESNQLEKIAFDSASDFSNASPSLWSEVTGFLTSVQPSLGASYAIFNQHVSMGTRSIATFGSSPDAANELVSVSSQPALIAASGAKGPAKEFLIGHSFEAASLSRKADFGIFFSTVRVHCDGEDAYYGKAPFLYNGVDKDAELIMPVLDSALESVALTSDFCGPVLSDGETGKIDSRISSAQINSDATASDFRIIYESTATDDQELRMIEAVGGTRRIVDLTSNRND